MAVGDHRTRPFNLDFRPLTYWPDLKGTKAALGRIKGTARRWIAKTAITSGLPDVPEEMLEPSLTEEDRVAWGRIHPSLMGGEYLPDLDVDEVEIVRLELQSTTADVISVRARRDASGIRYRIVDEYNDLEYVFSPERSETPLTLAELVALLDHACAPGQNETMEAYGLVQGFWEWNFQPGSDPEDAVNFVTVSSPFYPALAVYYRDRADEWISPRRSTQPPTGRDPSAAKKIDWTSHSPEDFRGGRPRLVGGVWVDLDDPSTIPPIGSSGCGFR